MAQHTLWLDADAMTRLSGLSGNIDIDKLTPFIYIQQRSKIRTILGNDLYNKINTDVEDDTLSGEYQYIMDEFIADMLVYFTSSAYIRTGTVQISNSGIHKSIPENSETIDVLETIKIAENYDAYGNSTHLLFTQYMEKNPLPEFGGCKKAPSYGMPWFLK